MYEINLNSISSMKVIELKEKLKKRGHEQIDTKKELLERLRALIVLENCRYNSDADEPLEENEDTGVENVQNAQSSRCESLEDAFSHVSLVNEDEGNSEEDFAGDQTSKRTKSAKCVYSMDGQRGRGGRSSTKKRWELKSRAKLEELKMRKWMNWNERKLNLFLRFMMEQKSPKIVIIGAGIAGIAAATSLLDRGFEDVTIIEAEDRIGGRIHTVPFGTKEVDIGAHWVHGEVDNAVYGLVHRLDLVSDSNDFNNVQFIADDGRSVPTDVGMLLFAKAGNILEDGQELKNSTGSLNDYLIPRCRQFGEHVINESDLLEAFVDWVTNFESTIEGCDNLSDVSAAGLTHYKQCDGNPILSWKSGGYYNIIDILLGRHPKCVGPPVSLEGRLSLNTEVEEIDWNGLVVIIKCKNGKLFKADHVIVTVSLGVLKEKYRTLFNPPLPMEKVRAIVGLGIGTVNKIYIRFPHRWWPEDCSGFSLLRIKRPGKAANNVGYPWEHKIIGFYVENCIDPTVITAWLVGDAAKEMEMYSDQEVLDSCYRELKAFLSAKYDIPPPEEIIRSKWYSNSHFRGSYSFRSINTEVLQVSADILAQPLTNDFTKNMLFFAGEATHSHYYSTVHGALESGWREARRLTEMYTFVPDLSKLKKSSL